MLTIMILGLIGYAIFEKYMETRQIDSVSKIEGLTYEELKSLIKQIKN